MKMSMSVYSMSLILSVFKLIGNGKNMRTTNQVRLIVIATAIFIYSIPRCVGANENTAWSAGYRFEVLTADGSPANEMMGSGGFLHYHIADHYRIEWSFEYVEYDFESPQRYLGFSRASTEEVESRTRSTLISVRVERSWRGRDQYFHPLVFTGLGMGYTVIDDIGGTENGEIFDINAEGGVETVPFCGAGFRYQHMGWEVDGGVKVERHFADWNLEDRVSGREGEVGDYTAWGLWLGLSVFL
jgi:hypothetical protein